MNIQDLKNVVRITLDAKLWRSGHLPFIAAQLINLKRNERAGSTDQEHLLAAANWLACAQDAMADGGICGRYSLKKGWTTSYPETTGYIIPTFLKLAACLKEPSFIGRAERAVEFLLKLQGAEGAFPGGEMDAKPAPSSFNTAQIINGLVSWYRETQDLRALTAANRAGE